MNSPPDLGRGGADAGSAQEGDEGGIKDLTEVMVSADRVYPAEAPTRDVEAASLEAEAARAQEREQQRELLSMRAADVEAECCREWSLEAASATEDKVSADRADPAPAPTLDVGAAALYGMEAIMAGCA